MDNLDVPFSPSDEVLRDLLKSKYIIKVSEWLLGKEQMSILAQVSGSAWESALTVITLSDVAKILDENNQNADLKAEISRKNILVADWLISKKSTESDFVHWEGVTWDTAVIIHALLIIVSEYKNQLSESKIEEIESIVAKGCKWLFYKFNQWDKNIKYPFGAADIAKLIITFTKFRDVNEELYLRVKAEYKNEIDSSDDGRWLSRIVEHLLQGRSEKKSTIDNDNTKEEIIIYWWDDYFTTAEVTEGLAVYYDFYIRQERTEDCDKKLLNDIKNSLIKACIYFEQGQVDGMWGSHIDTIKVVYSYVLIRRLVKHKQDGKTVALIEPEIHTVFKALRWMCDEKQRFSDGSFMHTMFLTVFFAAALTEVYRSWSPAQDRIDKIYDDVVWSSPVRTTPERIKRLSLEIKNSNLEDIIRGKDIKFSDFAKKFKENEYKHINTIVKFIAFIALFPIIFFIFNMSGITVNIDTSKLIKTDLFSSLGILISLVIPLFVGFLNRNSVVNFFSSNATNEE